MVTSVNTQDVNFAEIVEGLAEQFGPMGECLDCGQVVSASGTCDCYVPFEDTFDGFLVTKYAEDYGYAA